MGIIKYILLSLFLLYSLSAQSQVTNDTVVFDGIRYVKHIVKVGESLSKIAKLHKVKVSHILECNEMQRKLYYNL